MVQVEPRTTIHDSKILRCFIAFILLVMGLSQACSSDYPESSHSQDTRQTIDPNVRSLLLESNEAYREGRYERALFLADSAQIYQPDLADIYFLRGTVLYRMKRLEEARESYRSALELNPNFPDVRVRLGDIAIEQGLLDDALDRYWEAIAIQPRLSVYAKIAGIYGDTGRADSARTVYERALEIDSTDAPIHFQYGQLLEKLGDYDTALFHSRKALALDPSNANYQFVIGSQLYRSGQLRESLAFLERAANALPFYYPAQYTLGQVLLRLDRPDEATHFLAKADSARALFHQINILEQAANRNPGYIEYWIQLGSLYHEANLYDRAMSAFDTADLIDPYNIDLQFARAKLAMANGRTEEAIQRFQFILETTPSRVDVLLTLGLAYAVTGQCGAARQSWNRVLSYQPYNETAKSHLSGLCRYQVQ